MKKLKDEVHNCEKCKIFPCSFQEEVSNMNICKDCPVSCCRSVVVPIVPCEKEK